MGDYNEGSGFDEQIIMGRNAPRYIQTQFLWQGVMGSR
jgi:hypothetical protein